MAHRTYLDTAGRHGFLVSGDAVVVLEHCIDGRWGACPLASTAADERTINRLARRHLDRKAHAFALPETLKGTAHR